MFCETCIHCWLLAAVAWLAVVRVWHGKSVNTNSNLSNTHFHHTSPLNADKFWQQDTEKRPVAVKFHMVL